MISSIEDNAREQIAQVLPDALRVALNDYQDLLTKPLDKESDKNHGERQDALRKSVAYIQLLLKTAGLLNLPDARARDHNNQIMLSALLQEAREEVSASERDMDGDRPGGDE